MSRYDPNKEYLFLPYERENIKGKLTKYELMIERNELLGHINDLFMQEFNLSYQAFKNLINEGFLVFNDADALIARYKEDLLEMYEEYIEEDYKEQLEEERWYYDMDDEDEEYYDEARDRWEHGVTESMFH
jgi:hypothetical protein